MMNGIECVKVNGQVIYQKDTIGIPDKIENAENKGKPAVIE